jgi:hypothetical protein
LIAAEQLTLSRAGLSVPMSSSMDEKPTYRSSGEKRAYYSHRAFTTCVVSSWKSEELDEHPHALFLTAARKSPGSCELGDTMEARPKQFR